MPEIVAKALIVLTILSIPRLGSRARFPSPAPSIAVRHSRSLRSASADVYAVVAHSAAHTWHIRPMTLPNFGIPQHTIHFLVIGAEHNAMQ